MSSLSEAAKMLEGGRVRSAREGEGWSWVNRAIMGVTGIRNNRQTGDWDRMCEEDMVPNSDVHCVSECGHTKRQRRDTGINMFFTSCRMKGINVEKAYTLFILGQDWQGNEIPLSDYMERGTALCLVFEAAANHRVG